MVFSGAPKRTGAGKSEKGEHSRIDKNFRTPGVFIKGFTFLDQS